ncbi:hypothetical protein HanIR_Chr11g0508171 [Helianthus annuus]|nr:hypothetical protein HanIR_Chr11g0508171 [Helianthus annuus]
MMLYHNLLAFLYLQQSVQESNHEFSFEKGKCLGMTHGRNSRRSSSSWSSSSLSDRVWRHPGSHLQAKPNGLVTSAEQFPLPQLTSSQILSVQSHGHIYVSHIY